MTGAVRRHRRSGLSKVLPKRLRTSRRSSPAHCQIGWAIASCSRPLAMDWRRVPSRSSRCPQRPAGCLQLGSFDRIGKGVRGAPRDALIADLAPADLRGASFGLRQAPARQHTGLGGRQTGLAVRQRGRRSCHSRPAARQNYNGTRTPPTQLANCCGGQRCSNQATKHRIATLEQRSDYNGIEHDDSPYHRRRAQP
jgi:hypothetical protein